MLLKEKEVKEIIDTYLRREKAGKVFVNGGNFGVDKQQIGIEVKDSSIIIGPLKEGVQIECKGSHSNIDRMIGQCLRYNYENKGLRTYIAIPNDHKKLDLIREICDFYNLPIGIMTISNNRQVRIAKKL